MNLQVINALSEQTVGHIAAERPLATRIFTRHGIDFCCGGGRPLRDACAALDLPVDDIAREIEAQGSAAQATVDWTAAPLAALIEHILEVHHRPLDDELPRLEAMCAKVLEVHGVRGPNLAELARCFGDLRADLEPHMRKEEQVLFPLILSGGGAQATTPVERMELDHVAAGALLVRLRELSDDYTPPAMACNTWRALYAGLEALESDLHEHIHLENNILFPRALAG